LLEIRKKAKKQKAAPVSAQPPAPVPAPAAEPVVIAAPPPPPAKQAAPPPPPPPPAAPGVEVTRVAQHVDPFAASFEAFLQQNPGPGPAKVAAAGAAAQPASEEQNPLEQVFLDLATEELYRHSYLADVVVEEVEQREVLSCMLAAEQYGINIHRIKEIIKVRDITEVPRAPRFILGIITLRGRVIPVFDLRERLALPVTPLGRESKIVVVHHNAEFYGLVVDTVIDVSRFPVHSIESTPPVMAGVEAKYIEGIGRAGDQMIILLNLDEVLNLEAAAA
jgi:purine-binding chemotaxis protein CheW